LNGGRIEMAIPRVVQKRVRLHAAILADTVRKRRLDAGGRRAPSRNRKFESTPLQQRVGHEPHGQNRTRFRPELKVRIQLSPRRVRAAYDRDGFIVVPDVFSAGDVAELRRVTDEFVSASATVTANDSVYDLEDTHSADEPRVRRLKAPHAIHPVYMRASRNPKVVELLTDLWGSLRYDSGKLNMKSAGYGAPIVIRTGNFLRPYRELNRAIREIFALIRESRSRPLFGRLPRPDLAMLSVIREKYRNNFRII
jgi:hypothetical protein